MWLKVDEKQKKMENAGNPLLLLFIFGVIIAFLFFIPEIYEKYNSDSAALYGIGTDKNAKKEEKTVDSKESDYFSIGGNIILDNFEFSKITLQDNALSINVISKLSGNYYFNKEEYYIEFYKSAEEKTLLGRRLLETSEVINDQKDTIITVDTTGIQVNESTMLRVIYEPVDTISPVQLNNNTLTCTKSNETYTYVFDDKFTLIKLDYKIVNDKTDEELNEYRLIKERLDNLNGTTTNITEEDTTFTFNTILDYQVARVFKINLDNKYDGATAAKTIKFKNEAKGFDCQWKILI